MVKHSLFFSVVFLFFFRRVSPPPRTPELGIQFRLIAETTRVCLSITSIASLLPFVGQVLETIDLLIRIRSSAHHGCQQRKTRKDQEGESARASFGHRCSPAKSKTRFGRCGSNEKSTIGESLRQFSKVRGIAEAVFKS